MRSVSSIAAILTSLLSAVALSSCSSPYESYISDACDGLRGMDAAFEAGDREALERGFPKLGSLEPAGEEAGGDDARRRDVEAVWNAQRIISIASFKPPEITGPDLVWRGKSLTQSELADVDTGLKVCETY